jgi:hypothetical protein
MTKGAVGTPSASAGRRKNKAHLPAAVYSHHPREIDGTAQEQRPGRSLLARNHLFEQDASRDGRENVCARAYLLVFLRVGYAPTIFKKMTAIHLVTLPYHTHFMFLYKENARELSMSGQQRALKFLLHFPSYMLFEK